jgi:SOS response regulatory protein OraA/RecX
MKPITPKQVKENIELPEIAIAVVNKLITQNFKGIESIFTKEKLIKELLERGYNTENIDIIINNIPRVYKQSGWNVEETKAGFIFTELLN